MWYVIQTQTGEEEKLVGLIEKMIPKEHYEECFCMNRECVRKTESGYEIFLRPMFPSYVFVETKDPKSLYFELKRVPKLAKLLSDQEDMFFSVTGEEERFLRNVQDAEDAVSESVLAAYENIRKLQKETAFKSWIFTILANTCRKKLKESGDRQKREEGAEDGLAQIPAGTPDYGIALDVRKAFFILSPEEQEIVALSVFGGYNSKEIGSALNLNPNTVRSKRSRALEKMEYVLE